MVTDTRVAGLDLNPLDGDSQAYYGGRYLIAESMNEATARAVAAALGLAWRDAAGGVDMTTDNVRVQDSVREVADRAAAGARDGVVYLGDSVYGCPHEYGGVRLWLDNGYGPSSVIVLEPEVLAALWRLAKTEERHGS